jgi:hypothetical protein
MTAIRGLSVICHVLWRIFLDMFVHAPLCLLWWLGCWVYWLITWEDE